MTRRSQPIARFSGIDISIHWTFYLLLAWVALGGLFRGGLGYALIDGLFLVSAFGCVLLHEFGHAFAARMFGISTHGITLYPIGGVAQLENIPRSPIKELVIALAGPAVNVVIALVLFPVVAFSSSVSLSAEGLLGTTLLERLLLINVGLVVFNLIPAFPMDGGRVLRAVCAMFTEYVTATRIAVRCGQCVAVAFAILGLFVNPMLLLIAAFVALAAQSELHAVIAADRQELDSAGPVIDAVRVGPARYATIVQPEPPVRPTGFSQVPPTHVTVVWSEPLR